MHTLNIKEYKNNLRLYYRKIRSEMNRKFKNKLDNNIKLKLFSLLEYKNSDVILTYVSKEIEVDTINIINTSLELGKKVAVPRCIPDKREMKFYIINSVNDLEIGSFNVLEPMVSKCDELTDFRNSLCIVPGFCFDQEGYRLGYGKGYYDRFLSNYPGIKVGLCYSNCIKTKLPHGYFDRSVNLLITDKYINNIGGRSNG